jgi:hypothetical protein
VDRRRAQVRSGAAEVAEQKGRGPGDESGAAQRFQTKQFVERYRRHHLGCAFDNSSLPVRYTRSSSAPLDGGIAPTMSIAHKGAVVGAKVMAASVLDLLTSAELLAAKKQFEQDTKDTKYFSLLPPGAKPPVDLNKDIICILDHAR